MHKDTRLTIAHGNGGKLMRQLIEEVFARHLTSPLLNTKVDAAILPWGNTDDLMVTTDGFTVQPLEFPGGDIGSLAIHGTVNDLAVAGAEPCYLALNAILEEGLEWSVLDRLVRSMAVAAEECSVQVVAGDTKVVRRGECGGVYFATTGIGRRAAANALAIDQVRPGDKLLVTGSVGDHGAAVMLAREEYGLSGELHSDSASVLPAARLLRDFAGLRFMRDPTRGGLATVLNEIASTSGLELRVHENQIPVTTPVEAVCEMLGFDPYYLACEGRIVAVVSPADAENACAALRGSNVAPQAAIIGEIRTGYPEVIAVTGFGGERILEELENEPLPRIC